MKVIIDILESRNSGPGCFVDFDLKEIPVIGGIYKRVNAVPCALEDALRQAREIGQSFYLLCEVEIHMDESLQKQIEKTEKAKAAAATNNNRPKGKSK
jgi:hypothetical protein